MELVKYDSACRALAEARTIDEVKEIANRATAARAYARQAKNRQLELDALEIRTRAERRLGEILLILRKEGTIGQSRGGRLIHLDDLGVDHNLSPTAQRLARLSSDRFEQEIADWRTSAETSQRVEVPLQVIRNPSIRADRQRAAARNGRFAVRPDDPFDKFRAPDGRKISDWRAGELDRIAQLFGRVVTAVRVLHGNMPISNPDPLDTMEMIFEQRTLVKLLESVWESPIQAGDAGLSTITESKRRRTRVCEKCGKTFIMKSLSGRAGRFCSRECAWKAQQSAHDKKHRTTVE